MRNLIRRHLFLCSGLLAFVSLQVTAQPVQRNVSCSEKKGSYSIHWTLVDHVSALKLPAKSGHLLLPKKYEVFDVIAMGLPGNLALLRKNGGTLTLPFMNIDKGANNVECLTFKVENSGTIPKALNDKYPDIVSLKGVETTNGANTVRFDYDGVSMNIAVVIDGINYLYAPYKVKKKTYYLLFRKTDNNGSSRPAR